VTTQGTSPVARALARATTASHVKRLLEHPDTALFGWEIEYDGDVLVTVTLSARRADYPPDRADVYMLTLDCDSYDVWPPETKFVNPQSRTYVVGKDAGVLPVITGLPNLGIHAQFNSFLDRTRVDQLVCFSYTRGYYDSNHAPQPEERWASGRHWLYSTIRFLSRALQPPYYQGRAA